MKKIERIRKDIDELNKEYDGINILMGLECNVISYDGDIDINDEILQYLDMLLVGFHYGARLRFPRDYYNMYVLNYYGRLSKKAANKSRELNTKALVNAIKRYDIDLITHPGAKIDIDTRVLAREAAKEGTALEINSSHGKLSLEYIKIAMEEDVKFMVNSDAHTPEDVGNFKKGLNRAVKAGLTVDQIINAED